MDRRADDQPGGAADEHSWVEQFGITRSYQALRNGIRQYYRDHHPTDREEPRVARSQPRRRLRLPPLHEPRVASR